MDLKELKQQEQQLLDLLSQNRSKQKKINELIFIEKHGINIGDAVEWIDGRTKRKGIITGIDFTGTTPYYYMATLLNSDNKLGKRVSRIWSGQMSSVVIISKSETNS